MMPKRFRNICEDCLMSYNIGDKFTARQFQDRLLANYCTSQFIINGNRIQSFFRGHPKVRMERPRHRFAVYERIE